MALKRLISSLLCAGVLFSILTCQTLALSTSATASILMDVDSGRVLYEQNADKKMLIASTTKIMTALVAVENGTLSNVVTIKSSHMAEGSSMYLKAGEQLTLETLLYGLLLCSGNDAVVAIADHVGGGVDHFVEMMNEKAQELGMSNSSFANPNGLDDEKHYSTARDMAKLAAAAVENETLVRLFSTRSVTIGGRTMTNHNKLLGLVEGCIGLKTGYTRAAGRTLVSCAQRNGQRLVAVTLQDGNDWLDHAAMLDYGFSAYPAKTFLTRGETVRQVPVEGSDGISVPLLAAEDFAWPLAEGEQVETRWEVADSLVAPLTAGQVAGQVVFLLNGEEIGSVELLCGEDVAVTLPEPMTLLQRLLNLLQD